MPVLAFDNLLVTVPLVSPQPVGTVEAAAPLVNWEARDPSLIVAELVEQGLVSEGGSQGMLVGNSSSGMFLVRAENIETPYCDPRPFRVNAGGVHAYVRTPEGKTKYLADLRTGDRVLIVDAEGKTEVAFVGRSKIEKRPMMLVEAEHEGHKLSLILQNAETIRLTSPDGSPISVARLDEGDEVLACIEESGRHFGVKIEESIVEK